MRYKYITVKLSRSSSLAVINSAAIGSWMLWQFLLAWLWKSEPTCHGLVQAILEAAQTCWPLIHFLHLANEVYWINFLWANWILIFSPYTLLLRVTLLHFSYCWWSTWWMVGSCVVYIIGKVQINWVSCKLPRSCLRWEHRMWQWAQWQMTQSIHVEMKRLCCEMKWMCCFHTIPQFGCLGFCMRECTGSTWYLSDTFEAIGQATTSLQPRPSSRVDRALDVSRLTRSFPLTATSFKEGLKQCLPSKVGQLGLAGTLHWAGSRADAAEQVV